MRANVVTFAEADRFESLGLPPMAPALGEAQIGGVLLGQTRQFTRRINEQAPQRLPH